MPDRPFTNGSIQPNSSGNPTESGQERLAIVVEMATEKDWEAYEKIMLEAYNSAEAEMYGITPENREERIAKEKQRGELERKLDISSDDKFVTLSWKGTDVVGMMRAKRKENGVWHMDTGYVKADFRNQGIGKRMYIVNLNEIRRRGGKKVTIAVKSHNDHSIGLAKFFGFKRVGEEDPLAPGFYMQLNLEK